MEKTGYYSITVRKFTVLTRRMDWMVKTQELYNEVLGFYYNLYLDVYAENAKTDGSDGSRQPGPQNALRELEKLTIVGRDKQPVPYPIPWEKVPLYFRRAAINGAVAAARSYLSRSASIYMKENPGKRTEFFTESVTFYKGMYRDLDENSITLKLWNGTKWQWVRCRLRGNTLPEGGEIMSPALILRKDRGELHIPCKQPVCDGRSAKERMETGERICSVVFTNKDASLVCCITDSGDKMESCLFLKGGAEYAHRCRRILDKINRSREAAGGGNNPYANAAYWEKIKNLNDHYAHQFSRQVIDYCVKHGARILVLPEFDENRKKIIMKQTGKFSPIQLSNSVRRKLKYKAWQAGIVVLEIQQHNISSVCSICGGMAKCSMNSFHCENGHQGNRYLNSARNLGRKCRAGFTARRDMQGISH